MPDCGHSVCVTCSETLLRTGGEGIHGLRCPYCRSVSRVGGLVQNYAMSDLLQYHYPSEWEAKSAERTVDGYAARLSKDIGRTIRVGTPRLSDVIARGLLDLVALFYMQHGAALRAKDVVLAFERFILSMSHVNVLVTYHGPRGIPMGTCRFLSPIVNCRTMMIQVGQCISFFFTLVDAHDPSLRPVFRTAPSSLPAVVQPPPESVGGD